MMQTFVLSLLLTTFVAAQQATDLPNVLKQIGIGYNLLYGNPDGANWKSGGEDPGLLSTRHILNLDVGSKLPEQLLYEHHDACVASLREEIVYNTKTYQNALLQRVTFSGKQDSAVTNNAFSLSSGFTALQTETNTLHYVVQDTSSLCTYGTARYQLSMVNNKYNELSVEFMAEVFKLPVDYNTSSYVEFIDNWGTHIVTGMKIGTIRKTRNLGKLKDLVKETLQVAPDDINISGPPYSLSSKYEIDIDVLKLRLNYPLNITVATYHLTNGAADGSDTLEPVSLELTSIDAALMADVWQCGQSRDTCQMSDALTSRLENLKLALQSYWAYKGGLLSQATPLMMAVGWPLGTFGLPKPKSGCPDTNGAVRWLEGWIKQETESQTPGSLFNSAHLEGSLTGNSLFTLWFCIKPDARNDFSLEWPAGDYCILKHQACPKGFSEGYVQWDDEDDDNSNASGGVLPDGSYNKNTRMEYCCRQDGQIYNPIVLPTESPFFLFQYKHGCQEVKGMTFSVEYLQWDDDDKTPPSTASIGDVHPGMLFSNVVGGATYSRIYYCYYEPQF